MNNSEQFYVTLDGFGEFSQFADYANYHALPDDWYVVITDIQGSTRAIEQGRYKEVNALSAASIMALLNAVSPLSIPYVFGGDGATVCIPGTYREKVEKALRATRKLALESFGFNLRTGVVSMRDILDCGHRVLIAKYQPQENFKQAMFQGDGLTFAEELVKDKRENNPYLISEGDAADVEIFSGFECRWKEIPSPSEETVAILVQAMSGKASRRQAVYQRIAEIIFGIYGAEHEHHPLREDLLELDTSASKLDVEARIRTPSSRPVMRWLRRLGLIIMTRFGRILMKAGIQTGFSDWKGYRQRLIANTDYRKCDETLRVILSGTEQQRHILDQRLGQLHQAGEIVYGMHASPAAMMTCLIFNYDQDHVHFLDGSNGGYALAAKQMKSQLKKVI